MKRSIAYSVIGHALLLLTLIIPRALTTGSTEADEGDKTGKESQLQGEIVPRGSDGQPLDDTVSITFVEKKATKSPGSDCRGKKSYGGVGIMAEWPEQRVTYVGEGYPADRAGDVILSPPLMRGEVGSTFDLTYRRGDQTYTVRITREPICVEDEQP